MERLTDGWTEGQMDGWTEGQTDGQTEGWMDGQTDGGTDGPSKNFCYNEACSVPRKGRRLRFNDQKGKEIGLFL